MIISAYLDAVDHTADVIAGGVQNLSYQVEDVEGKLTIPNVTIKFCNLKKTFTNIIPNASINHIALKTGRQDIFQGTLTPDGFLYDPDDERVEIKCIGTENYFIDQLKNVKLNFLPLKRIQKTLSIVSGSGTGGVVSVDRFFYSIKDVLNLMIGYAGIDSSISNIQIDSSLCVGGLSASSTSTIVNNVVIPPLYLPDITCYDFLVEVVKLFNGVWWIDSASGFIFYPKTQLIAQRQSESPILLAPIRNTMDRSDEYLGWDQVTFSFANSTSIVLPPGIDYLQWIIYSSLSPQKPNTVASIFKNPFNIYYHPVAFIDAGDLSSNDYLIRTGSTMVGKDQKVVDAGEITRTYYTVDLRAGMSVVTDCTLIGENDFFSNWPPVYTHVRFPNINQDYFLRAVTPDFKEERIQIHAVNYEPD